MFIKSSQETSISQIQVKLNVMYRNTRCTLYFIFSILKANMCEIFHDKKGSHRKIHLIL